MNTIKSILVSTFGFFAIAAAAVGFSSCEQDSCTVLNCANGGQCVDGTCKCPSGYDGSECNTALSEKYAGVYEGTVRCNYGDILFPIVPDTVYVENVAKPNKVKLKIKAGNTSLENFNGTIRDKDNIDFDPLVSYDANGVEVSRINCFVDFDGDLIKVYLQTTNSINNEKQSCSFIGKRYVAP